MLSDNLSPSLDAENNLKNHLQTNEQDRDFSWDEKFFKLLSLSRVSLISMEPQQGPDHWPYIFCSSATDQKALQVDSSQKVLRWLSEKGIGLVVNPDRKPYPDFVFSYGMIWYFRETGFFMNPPQKQNVSTSLTANAENKWFTGAPSENYLPTYVRGVLKNFFADQLKHNVKIMMLSADQKNYDLAISIESLGNPPQSEHAQAAEALAWFLPPHYTVALVSEAGFPAFSAL